MRSAAVGFQCPECISEGQSGARQPRRYSNPRYVRSALTRRPDIVTMTLIGINVVVYLAKLALAGGVSLAESSGGAGSLAAHIGLIGRALYGGQVIGVSTGEYYRLLTAMFLHFSLLHIALNMYALYLLGPPLETLLGKWRYLALYFVGGLGGSALAYLLSSPGQLEGGASGAIFGLFAAFYIIGRQRRINTTPILIIIGLNLVLSFVIPGIGYLAHIGGLVTGGLIALAYAYAPRGRPWRLATQIAGPAVLLAAVIAVTAVRTVALT
jgi:membrane associated rhomboid family serine protease